MLDFRNVNTLWASVLVETLFRLGLRTAVISPGSRSTPLTVALARHGQVDAIPILDERSAGFFALGVAKASDRPVVLVCTSGTAGANYFPAVIEAYESEVPLIVLTADRPPELRDCASGQTIDQQKLFGQYVRGYIDLALPETRVEQLRYLRQVMAQVWRQCCFPIAGPVHINCAFRDPLAPVAVSTADLSVPLQAELEEGFFRHLSADTEMQPVIYAGEFPLAQWQQTDRGLIIAGPASPNYPERYCRAIASLSNALGWPVLADGLSPLRNHAALNPHLVTTYDALLRHPHQAAALVPEQVIQLGPLPTSKVLRQWLAEVSPLRWVLQPSGRNKDPLHGATSVLTVSPEALATVLPDLKKDLSAYGTAWMTRQAIAQQRLAEKLAGLEKLFEGKLSWLLPNLLPEGTPVMVANSMPVRDVEWFWPLGDRRLRLYFNRGANGIDGTLSTAMGIAHTAGHTVLLTGDLALLHDSNGFLNANHRQGTLTILLINNQGGGIFETLPIAQFEPPFEAFFATPQQVDFAALAAAHQIGHRLIPTWGALADHLANPSSGVQILELRCDRKFDGAFRAALLDSIGDFRV